MMEGVSSSKQEPVNHCVVHGSFNKVFMAGEGSNISVTLFEEHQHSNSDSGYDDDTSPMDSAANEQEIGDDAEGGDKDVEHPVPMEMDNAVTSCIVKGSDNMVVMSGDGSNIKVNIGREVNENIPEGVEENHADINANNNNINNNLYPVQQDTDALPIGTKEPLLDDTIDVGERPVAHVQPLLREKLNEQEIPSNLNQNSRNAMPPSYRADEPSPAADPPALCSKRRVEDECNEFYKKQKLNDTASQECARGSCQTNYQVKVEGANNTAITAGHGSTINLSYYQCKHSREKSKDDLNPVNIDHVDGEALKKTGMMPFFKRISKHIGSTSNKWKQLARELPMVAYEHLEREIRVLEQTQATTEQKAFAVLVKWWKGNTGATSMKKSLVVALRYIKLPWLASSLEKEIQQGLT